MTNGDATHLKMGPRKIHNHNKTKCFMFRYPDEDRDEDA